MLICAREECQVEYEPKTHNQKYHSAECCRIATNARMMRKYHQRQRYLKGEVRMCEQCSLTKLSRYNPSNTCAACTTRIQNEVNENLYRMLENVVA
jgi:hypothetical protein